MEITRIGKWKESYPIKKRKSLNPLLFPLDSHQIRGSSVEGWANLMLGLLPGGGHTICATTAASSLHNEISVKYKPGEQRDKIERHFLFRKNELQNEHCFLKSLSFLSMLLHGLVFNLATFLFGQVGWSPLSLTLLLWCDFLSSLLFVPHNILVLCSTLR